MSNAVTIDRAALLRAAQELEPLPPSALRLSTLLSNPDWDPDEVGRAVRFDPALTAKMLRVANSAALGSRQRISTVEAAIVRLGPGSVLALALGSSLGQAIKRTGAGYCGEPRDLWSHAVAASFAAENLRRKCTHPVPVESATAALLHDVGKLVLARAASPSQKSVIEFAVRERGLELHQAELEQLGIHHGELGGAVAADWGLPAQLVSAIAFHHQPDASPEVSVDPLVAAVRLADLCANRMLDPIEERSLPPADCMGAAQVLGFQPSSFPTLCADVLENLHELESLYS